MGANVRIEDEAFVDPRVELLGTLAGYNRFEALGRLAHLWRVCTQRETYVLQEPIVIACLGDKGPDAIVQAGLGERTDGGIRVKGTAGRIEWLSQIRKGAKAGGEANKSRVAARGQAKGSASKPRRSGSTAKQSLGVAPGIAPGEPNGSPGVAPGEPNGSSLTSSSTASSSLTSSASPAAAGGGGADAPRSDPKTFVPPTVEQVAAYCRERNNRVDAERFVDFYASKGWMVGKNKMKDWKAAVRNWEKDADKPRSTGTLAEKAIPSFEEFLSKGEARGDAA